jgi:hypothetical protein
MLAEPMAPTLSVTVSVYTVVTEGEAYVQELVESLSPSVGVHEY